MIQILKNKVNKQNMVILFILILIAFFICMLSPLDIFSFNGRTSTDSSVFKYIGWAMSNGQVPYLDTFDHKGLLLYFINLLGYLISPHRGLWFLELIFMFFTVFFVYKISNKFVSKYFSVLNVLIVLAPIYNFFAGGNFTEEFALPFQLLSLFVFIDFFLNSDKYMNNDLTKFNTKFFNVSVFLCGICFACVLFLRPNMISIWAVFSIMVLIYCFKKKKWAEIGKFILSFVLGMFVIFIPVLYYLFSNNAFNDFVNDYILFNMNYSAYNTSVDNVNAFKTFFNNPVVVLSFLIVIIKIYLQVKNKENCFFNVGYLVYMFVTLLLISMSGRAYGHYGMSLIPMLVYPFCFSFKYIKSFSNKDLQLFVLVFIVMVFIMPNWINIVFQGISDMSDKYNSTYYSDVVNYINKNTSSDDLISVVGNEDIIYNFSERMSASKYSYQQPIATIDKDIQKEYFKDLEKNQPKIIASCIDLDVYPEFKIEFIRFIKENNYRLVLTAECGVYEK